MLGPTSSIVIGAAPSILAPTSIRVPLCFVRIDWRPAKPVERHCHPAIR